MGRVTAGIDNIPAECQGTEGKIEPQHLGLHDSRQDTTTTLGPPTAFRPRVTRQPLQLPSTET